MVDVHMDPATKKISLPESELASLSPDERDQATRSLGTINRIMADLVAYNGDVPAASPAVTTQISTAAAKLVGSGSQALQRGRPAEALKLISTAFEMVLRRPYWESTQVLLDEVLRVLSARSDAYLALKQWPEVYADSSLILLLNPADPMAHYRIATTFAQCGRLQQALDHLERACKLAPNEKHLQESYKVVQAQLQKASEPPVANKV